MLWWTSPVISVRRRWVGAALVLGLGWLATPQPVAIYDGIGVPDEPYRYVQAPTGKSATPAPTSAIGKTPVKNGVGTNGLSVSSAEQSAQFSLFVPPAAMAAAGDTIEVKAVPQAATNQPKGAVIGGNVYVVTLTSSGGPVTLTEKAAIATLYIRATTATDGWLMEYRSDAAASWKVLQTSRGGTDSFVATFAGPGQYALARSSGSHSKGSNSLLLVLLGVAVLLVAVVVIVRVRATRE